jgi:hypothetical protein
VKRLSNDEGSALVEFAIVLPAFLVVVLGSITFVWLLGARSAVTGAARDGARYASIQHDFLECSVLEPCDTSYPDQTEVQSYIRNRAGVFGSGIDVTLSPTEQPDRNEVITVTASRSLPSLVGPVASLFGIKDIKYTTTAVARAE